MIDYYRLEHEHEYSKNTIVINWCLLNICNYKCSYCPEFLHNGSTGLPDLTKVINFCKVIINHYENKNIYFEFTGGEVTYWKDFTKLVDFLKTYKNVFVGAISNGSNSLEWWDAIKDKLDHICLSFQPEFANKDHYIDLTKLINGHMRTHVNIMMHPDYFDLCIKVVSELSKNVPNISIALQPLLVDFADDMYKYSKEQLDIIDKQYELYGSKVIWNKEWPVFRGSMKAIGKDKFVNSSAHRFISDGVNHWKGWKCYAGVEQIVVDTEGNVFRGWCKEGGVIGNIKNNFTLPTKPIICNRDFCHCNFDIMSTKEKV